MGGLMSALLGLLLQVCMGEHYKPVLYFTRYTGN